MPELVAEELEEAVELVGVAAQCRGQRGGVGFRRLERADVELEAVAEAVDPPEDADGVSLAEPAVEERDIAPDPRLDPAARVYELEREVIGAVSRLSLRRGGRGPARPARRAAVRRHRRRAT